MDDDSSTMDDARQFVPTRRQLLGAIASSTLAAMAGCTADGDDTTATATPTAAAAEPTTTDAPAAIHPSFGYPGTGQDVVPDAIDPDHTVELHTDEELIIERNGRPIGIEFGAFHFDPVALHVDPGDVVKFQLQSPDHTVTSLHPGFGRQQRVPSGVPWFSSPVVGAEGFWLYRFDEPGVYDVVCAPHELFGMAMRFVVGDVTEPVVRGQGRPPALLSGALLGTGAPGEDGSPDLGVEPLSPANVVDAGSVDMHGLGIDLAVPLSPPTPPSELGGGE